VSPIVGTETVVSSAYWKKNIPAWDYGTLFLFGTFLGALLSALVSRSFHWEIVPETWRQRFGARPATRLAAAFFGGVLTMFGARLAGGCTSGHGISGSLQLAVSSWTFFVVMFLSGLLTAKLLFNDRSLRINPGDNL
jgi:uncharacterized membrane protein YedE/YeeE